MTRVETLHRSIAGEEVWLLAERALYWPARETLVVADLHWGKGATFRRAGLPIPAGSTAEDLERLDQALSRTAATRLLVLGDLFHARSGRKAPSTHDALASWRRQHPTLEILLVRGNHDRQAGDPTEDMNINCVDEPWIEGPFAFRHHPDDAAEQFVIHGHVHPYVRLSGRGRQHVELAAFVIEPTFVILPAFGSFTGGALVERSPDGEAVALADAELFPLPRGLARHTSL